MDSSLQENIMRRLCIGDLLRRTALNKPNKEAIVYNYEGEIKERITYGELNRKANRFANALKELGIKKGNRVAIVSYNCIQYAIYMSALSKMGAWITPFNFALKSRELLMLINHSEPVMLIIEDDLVQNVMEIVDDIPSVKHFVMIDLNGKTPLPLNWHDFDDLCSDQHSEEEPYEFITGDDVLTLLYTSGTESMPKGVMNTHANWYSSIMSLDIDFGNVITGEDTELGVIPMFHVGGGCMIFQRIFSLGGRMILLHRPEPQIVMKVFEGGEITTALVAPTVMANLLNVPDGENLIKTLFGSLKSVTLYGSPTTDAMMKKIMELLPNTFFQNYYGQSEVTPLGTTLKSNDILRKMKESNERFNGAEAIGQSHALVEMKVVDDTDHEVTPGTIGEMVIRSPAIMKGYYKEEEKTRATFKNGWHHTGDLAIMDEERFYYFVDRKKDMIKTGAENVSSVEVEQWIAAYPKVAECVVVGLFHPRWIEAVTAFVVPSHGESLTGEEIVKFCKDGLAGYKVPKKVIIVEELPKLPSGKVLKRDLKANYKNLFED